MAGCYRPYVSLVAPNFDIDWSRSVSSKSRVSEREETMKIMNFLECPHCSTLHFERMILATSWSPKLTERRVGSLLGQPAV